MTATSPEHAAMSDTQRPGHQPTPDRRRRHLMDPNAPRPVSDPEAELRLRTVQRWVMSTLAVTTILHLSVGLVLAAMFLPQPSRVAEVLLSVIAGAFGAIAVGSWLAIHGHKVASWWLVAGFLPTTAIGLALTSA